MSVTIPKEGSEPTRITVKRGEETWDVTEKELDKLPADVRPAVDRMLGGMVLGPEGVGSRFDFVPDLAASGKPDKPSDDRGGLSDRLEDRLDKMNQRIERLQKASRTYDKAGPEQEKKQ